MKLNQSGNKIVVTELNPMSGAPTDKTILLKIKGYKDLTDGRLQEGCCLDVFEGWLPMPVYEPEAK